VPRREFLAGLVVSGLAASALGACRDGQDVAPDSRGTPVTDDPVPRDPTTADEPAAEVDLADDPFGLGVASGDPTPESVVLWTRLFAVGTESLPASVPVSWVVATDEAFERIVADGVAEAIEDHGHSVHVDATGLAPSTTYWYRFRVGPWVSTRGRTRTAPASGSDVASVSFAVANCQAYQSGWYTAYRDIATADVDAVLFLGDFVYELESSVEVRPHGMAPAVTLDDYRRFYEINCQDPDLQAARAAHPWVVTWDDHEVEDNYAALEPGQLGRELAETIDGGFPARRAAAYAAWWEHQPVRGGPPVDGVLPIHRDLRFGSLVTLAVLDTRQHRSPVPEGDGRGALPRGFGGGPQPPGAFAIDATMLGSEQEAWIDNLLGATVTSWVVIAQQSAISQIDRRPDLPGGGFSVDGWDGYVVPRQRLLDRVVGGLLGRVVFLGGDLHTSMVADVRRDPTDASTAVIAAEIIGPSISALELLSPEALTGARTNPHIHLYDIDHRGWLRVDIDPSGLDATFRYVDATVPDATAVDGTRWHLTLGDPEIASLA
jgi:alkaline phosphatase D